MGAAILKVPELELSEAEAKKLDAALSDVMSFYTDAQLSPLALAWLNLAMAGGTVYGPRFIAHSIRKKSEAKKTIDVPKAPASPVIPFVQPNAATGAAPKTEPKKEPPKVAPIPPVDLRTWSHFNAQEAVISASD